jgi:hypothetical protein
VSAPVVRLYGLLRTLTLEMERWTFATRDEAEQYCREHAHPNVPTIVVVIDDQA